MYEAYFRYETGSTLYVKPLVPPEGLQTPWPDDVINGVENPDAPGQYYWASLDNDYDYEIFVTTGSPSSSDEAVGYVESPTGPVSGALITFTVTDGTDAVRNCVILDSGSDAFANTNDSGQAYIYKNDGTYTFNILPPFGFETPAAEVVVVSGSPVTVPIVLSPSGSPTPSSPELCSCTIQVVDSGGTPIQGAVVYADPASIPQATFEQDFLIFPEFAEPTTDSNGQASFPLVRNVTYTMKVAVDRYNKVDFDFSVPDAGSAFVTATV